MRARSAGAALLLVLWLILLLAGLTAAFALNARTEGIQGSALRQMTSARYAAEAGIELAALRLLDANPARRWVPDGRAQTLRFEGYKLSVRVFDEGGKVDLNVAGPELLSALMVAVGVDELRAAALAGAIQDWRDADDLLSANGAEDSEYEAAGLAYGAKDQPFATVDELQQVLGMDHDTFIRLRAHLTVYTGEPRPAMRFATGPVLQALGLNGLEAENLISQRLGWRPGLPPPPLPDGSVLAPEGSGTYSISSLATRPDGAAVEVAATVRMGASGVFGQPYLTLAWRVGEND